MKKGVIIAVVAAILTALAVSAASAQQIETAPNPQDSVVTTSETDDVSNIGIDVGTQSVWTGKVPLLLTFKANSSSDKTEINWDGPTWAVIESDTPDYFTIQEGQTYTFKAHLNRPPTSGKFTIAANITVWQADTNVTSNTRITLEFDEEGRLLPVSQEYQRNVLIRIALIVVLIVIGGIGLIFGAKVGINKLKDYLKAPEF